MTHLWTPWRATYMNRKKETGRCIFCDAAAGNADEQNLVVYRGQLAFVLLNRYPYTSGHLLIAPYVHVPRLAQLSPAAAEEIMRITRAAEEILERVYQPDGLNLGMNLGKAAGAGVEQHLHMHVLPRWEGDANFMTTVSATRIIPEALPETFGKLQQAFSNGPSASA